MRPTQAEKARAFRALHEGEPFVISNPWDAGSAKVLEGLGFKALATTSSGFAFTLGRPDGSVGLDELTEHVRTIADATALPVSVDLENGFGAEPEAASRAILAAAGAGAVGGSIEDFGEPDGIYPLDHATERIAAGLDRRRGDGDGGRADARRRRLLGPGVARADQRVAGRLTRAAQLVAGARTAHRLGA